MEQHSRRSTDQWPAKVKSIAGLASVLITLAVLASTFIGDRAIAKQQIDANRADIVKLQSQVVQRQEMDDLKQRLSRIENKVDTLLEKK